MIKVYSYYFEALLFKFSFGKEEGADFPPWLENEEFPPLSPRKAIKASKSVLSEMLKDYPWAEPQFHSCALKRISEGEDGWWYYDVDWMVWPPECDGGDQSVINVPVMLNGEVPPYEIYNYEDRFDAWK